MSSSLIDMCKAISSAIDARDAKLYEAVQTGDVDTLKDMLEKNESSDLNDEGICRDGHTLLHAAAENNRTEVVKWLVLEGLKTNGNRANPDVKKRNGVTPLHLAAARGRVEVTKCLVLECKANVHVKDIFGQTPLHLAVEHGELDTVKCLVLDCKADVNVQDQNGRTPLWMTKMFDQEDVADWLAQHIETQKLKA